jgi:hypothetical protein
MVTLVNTRDVLLQSAPIRSTSSGSEDAQATADQAIIDAAAAQADADAAAAAAAQAIIDAAAADAAAADAQADADAITAVVNHATTGLAQRMRLNADNILGGVLSANTIATPAGFRAGNVVWDATGAWVSGSGVAITPTGLVGYNSSGVAQFSINASTGIAVFAGSLNAASGSFAGSLSAVTGTFATITAGHLQNAGDTNYIELNATGTNTFIKVGTAIDIKADGTGLFAREIVSDPDIIASGTKTVSSGTLNPNDTWIDYIDTGEDIPGGWATSSTAMYLASVTIAGGTSNGGGLTGYSNVTVVHGDGLMTVPGSIADNRLYIKFHWQAPTSGGDIAITSLDWKLVRV